MEPRGKNHNIFPLVIVECSPAEVQDNLAKGPTIGFNGFDISRLCRFRIERVTSWHLWAFSGKWQFLCSGLLPFFAARENRNIYAFANITSKITVRVSNLKFSDSRNAMDTLVL